MPAAQSDNVLDVDDLRTYIRTKAGIVRSVDGVSLSIRRGEIFGLAGESGSGKSMTAFSILRLLPRHGYIVGGSIRFGNRELRDLTDREMRDLRGNRIAMIFQDPMSSLNPVLKVGYQIREVLRQHRGMSGSAARAQAVRLLEMVEIPSARSRYRSYPHEFSGGMRQRVMIAMALACSPDLLIADEPTTALDVTVEKQILRLLQSLRRDTSAAILLITHNLSLMAEHCDRVAVMYAGQVVETADTATVFRSPMHPYTRALLDAMPRKHISEQRLVALSGLPPVMTDERRGCAFTQRCPSRIAACADVAPQLIPLGRGHFVRCALVKEPAS